MPELSELTLPVLPLPNGVVLPQMVITLALETSEATAAAEAAGEDGHLVLVPSIDGVHRSIGVVARVESTGTLPSGNRALVVRALHRARVRSAVVGTTDALWVEVEPLDEPRPTERARELAIELRAAIRALLDDGRRSRLADALPSADEPGPLADAAGWWPELSTDRKVELLEAVDPERRVELVLGWAKEALAERELSERIRTDVTDGMERQQREFLLRQQLAAIRKELGDDGEEDLADGYRTRLAELADALPEATQEAITREIDRLEQTNAQAVEHGWIRTWLDTILDVPWATRTDDRLDLDAAREVLDADHHGLQEVKDRLVEFLAVRKLRAERDLVGETADRSPDDGTAGGRPQPVILALVGPPGVGKTSLGESVARALGRNFVRVALGGVRDEAEIRGHRRTYVGAQPGRIVRALQEAGSMNPVFLLDEIDKVGNDWRGDPSSALLEVLDPAQNHSFRDHYLEVELDLSDVVFIATANVLDTVPGPLLDRLEVVRLDGYTEDEKLAIARDHLLPRQERLHGLRRDEVRISEPALRTVIADHTREAGVRGLERALARLLRKAAVGLASEPGEPVEIGPDEVRDALGRPAFRSEVALRTAAPGVATGLAVTGAGGDVLFVEATATGLAPATDAAVGAAPGLTVTGQLGDVMKESASIALSYIRSRAEELGIPAGADRVPVHVHVPAGAVPKDGPSAGVTLTSALVSLFTGRPVRPTVGMTGEVTLHGRVLPIGGVKQKVLAAARAGLTEVVLPAENGPDLDDVPESVRQAMTFHLASDVTEVLDAVLEPNPAESPAAESPAAA